MHSRVAFLSLSLKCPAAFNIENKFMNDVYEVNINNESFLYIFLTNSCQSYNQVYKNKKVTLIAIAY